MLARRALPRLRHQPIAPSLLLARRACSTTELSNGITLAYDLHEPPSTTTAGLGRLRQRRPPIVMLHGLFGSRRNSRSVILARDLNRPVYTMDMRNHGASSHHPTHTYTALAEDLELFLHHHEIKNAAMVGHSMGAKTVMTLALRNAVQISSLIPVDNAPIDAALHTDFAQYVMGMRKIDESGCTKQSEADAILQPYCEEIGIRQFLLANLDREPSTGHLKFKIPIKILTNALDHMADFPFTNPDEVRWEGPTLMVRGTQSHYVADETLPIVGRFFPMFEVCDIESGHWVISEKPAEFCKAVVEFLQDKD